MLLKFSNLPTLLNLSNFLLLLLFLLALILPILSSFPIKNPEKNIEFFSGLQF